MNPTPIDPHEPAQEAEPLPEPTQRGYYGLPVLKAPVWRWEIWSYFFLGGLAAGSYLVASTAFLAGDPRDRRTSTIGYALTCGALLLCPPLLIKDLGRPERFLNMLRVFKPGSPMSLGIWGLLGFTACAFATLARCILGDRSALAKIVGLLLPMRPLVVVGSALAAFVGGYTGVLLSVTSVPLWSRSRCLGPAFFASALSSGASAVAIALCFSKTTPTSSLHKVERVKILAAAAEGVALVGFLWQTSWAAQPIVDVRQHGRAFFGGAVGLGVIVPIVAGLLLPRDNRQLTFLRSLGALVGGVFLRYALVEGGRRSADDPDATFRHTDKPSGPPSK